jgi:signal transduction histidine kinase
LRQGSLRLRLWSAAAISLVVALAVAGLGLVYLFELHVERRIESELEVELNQLIAGTRFVADRLEVQSEPSDPRFSVPLSGYYWQVEDPATQTLIRSRSLWDEALVLPDLLGTDGSVHLHEMPGPNEALLIAVERTITEPDGRSFRAMVTGDHVALTSSVSEYVGQLAPSLALLAAILLAANFVQIGIGLAPLDSLRVAVGKVITGGTRRLEGEAPNEVRPLSDEINRLLAAQEAALSRARTRATDLAHGLKTPLQVLAADVRALRDRGETQLADDVESSVGAIRSHVDRELARARVASGVGGARTAPVAGTLAKVVDVVRRTPFGRDLQFETIVDERLVAPVDEGDLSEILGNLVENAARFAATRVAVEVLQSDCNFALTVIDDGPGVPAERRDDVLARGISLDAGHGTGLGLAIVSDIVEAYDGRVELTDASPGLKVTVLLPRPASEQNYLRQSPGRNRP